MLDPATLVPGLIFGSIGFGFFIYGKRQSMFVPIFTGMVLMALPYLVTNPALLIGAALVLICLPFFVRF